MSKSNEVFKVVTSHGQTVNGMRITLSTGKCLALFHLLQETKHQYVVSEVTEEILRKDVHFRASNPNSDTVLPADPVQAALNVLEGMIAPVVQRLGLITPAEAVSDILKASDEVAIFSKGEE